MSNSGSPQLIDTMSGLRVCATNDAASSSVPFGSFRALLWALTRSMVAPGASACAHGRGGLPERLDDVQGGVWKRRHKCLVECMQVGLHARQVESVDNRDGYPTTVQPTVVQPVGVCDVTRDVADRCPWTHQRPRHRRVNTQGCGEPLGGMHDVCRCSCRRWREKRCAETSRNHRQSENGGAGRHVGTVQMGGRPEGGAFVRVGDRQLRW